MEPRLKFKEVDPDGFRAFLYLQWHVDSCGLEQSLLHLIRLRASQIDGCAYCIDAHTKDARAQGETEQRLYALSAWRETPFYTERERAALAWTEALTLISENNISDDLYESARLQFSQKELVDLTLAIIHINGWNRMANSFRLVPGTYQLQRMNHILEQA
jgi:AhpD family alkylhydroperoxidase